MVPPKFSEFQFAYGVTRELEDSLGPDSVAPPFFPTQRQEKKIGSDVVLRIEEGKTTFAPVFIQYKRAERMVRSDAKEWNHFGQKYFRFKIHTVKQHNTLVELSRGPGLACYVAPGFHTQEEYIQHHRNNSLGSNSVCVDGSQLPMVDHDRHRVAYTISPQQGVFRSEPKQIDIEMDILSSLNRLYDQADAFMTYQALQETFRSYRSSIIERLQLEIDPQYYEAEEPAEWIRSQQQFFRETADTELVLLRQGEN